MVRRRRRARGFTLLELLISMALASVGLLGLMALQVTATRGNASSRSFMEAVGIAQERIEMAQTEIYASIGSLVEGTCPLPITTSLKAAGATSVDIFANSPAVAPNTEYFRCTQVTANATSGTTYVQVSVQWTEYNNLGGTLHNVTLSTTRSP